MFEYIILVSVVAAGICGIVITRNVFGSDQIHGKLKHRYTSYISDLETDNKKLTGKLNKMKQNITISSDDFDKENPLSSISGLISQFAPMLPKNIQQSTISVFNPSLPLVCGGITPLLFSKWHEVTPCMHSS